MRYFGGAHLRLPTSPTPTGKLCQYCGSPICDGDTGLLIRAGKQIDPSVRADPWHLPCFKNVLPLMGQRIEVEGRTICWLSTDVGETRGAATA